MRDVAAIKKLAKKMRTVPRRGFFMDMYFDETAPPPSLKAIKNNAKCGTAACIAGWAVVFFPQKLEFGKMGNIVSKGGVVEKSGHVAFGDAFGFCNRCADYITTNYSISTPIQASNFLLELLNNDPCPDGAC